MKATHEGTCQVCGHQQRLPGGRLAKHGYSVRWGFFSGTCGGSHELPFEVSIDRIDASIRSATQTADLLRTKANNLGRDTVWVYERYRDRKRMGEARWREIERGYALFVKEYGNMTVKWTGLDGAANHTHVEYGYDNDEERAVTLLNGEYAKHLLRLAREYDRFVIWQHSRIKGWVPHPEKLIPVLADERTGPLLHFRGGYGKLCAGSYMGAQKGHATTVAAQVTCPKCRAHPKFPKEVA